jgi:hypothetical protein
MPLLRPSNNSRTLVHQVNIEIVKSENYYHQQHPEDAYVVLQANERPLANQQSFCKIVDKKVMALVPACFASVQRQVPPILLKALSACYKACIWEAFQAGAKKVMVPPLGVMREEQVGLDVEGKPQVEIKGDLFWSQAKSSLAAKEAVIELCSLIPDEFFTVIFVVTKDAFDDWDSIMIF